MALLILLIIIVIIFFVVSGFGQKPMVSESGEILIRKGLSFKGLSWLWIPIAIIVILILGSIHSVSVGRCLVVFNTINKTFWVARQGVNFVFPVINNTTTYDLRILEYTMTAKAKGRFTESDVLWSPTKEGLQVGIDLTCLYRLDPEKVFEIHQKIGPNFEAKIVRPALRSIVRMVISENGIMDVYSAKRQAIQEEIFKRVSKALKPHEIIVRNILLRNITFSDDFARAVEQKQIAQQEAERMSYVIDKERKEADRKAIEAGGKARAIEIVSKELRKSPRYINYLYVDKLTDKIKVIVTDQSTIMNLQELMK